MERWRGIALLQADPDRYAATVRRIAERKTGRPVPRDEPFSVTRRAAGLQPVYEVSTDFVDELVAGLPSEARAQFARFVEAVAEAPLAGFLTEPDRRDEFPTSLWPIETDVGQGQVLYTVTLPAR